MPRMLRPALATVAALAIGLGGAVLVAAPASAGTTTDVTLAGDGDVPGTLRYAINEANAQPGPDVIDITPVFLGIEVTSTLPALVEGVTINGAAETSISRTGPFDILHIAPGASDDQAYAFNQLRFEGEDLADGRAIVANTAVPFDSLSMNGVVFTAFNAAVGSGGAVLIDQAANGPIDLVATAFTNNSAPISGGGLSVTNAASLSMTGFGSFGTNAAAIGGGLAANDIAGAVTIDNIFFSENTATDGSGGGLSLHSVGSVSVTGADAGGANLNFATDNGGFAAIDDVLGTVNVADLHFPPSGNEAEEGSGGVLWIQDVATLTVTNTTFGAPGDGNIAGNEGGAVYVERTLLPVPGPVMNQVFTDVVFEENTAGSNGGGLSVVDVDSLTVTGGAFLRNSAERGGGLSTDGVTSLVVVQGGANFDDNHATVGSGGGLLLRGTTPSLQLNDVTLQYNDAVEATGGGLYVQGAYTTTLTDVQARNNVAQQGGGLYVNVFNTSVLVQDSFFSENGAQEGNGGAINIQQIDPDDNVTVLRTTFEDNSAIDENPVGGAVSFGANDGTVKIDSSTFHDNEVAEGGNGVSIGASQVNREVVDIVNSTFEETESPEAFAIHLPGNIGTVQVHSSTITALGGLSLDQNSGDVVVLNTILDAAGTLETVYVGGQGDPADARYSLFSDAFDPLFLAAEATNRFEVADMRLGALASNGGPTQTRLPAADSPAVNHGNAAVDAELPSTDQRGTGYPRVVGVLDIGAVEVPAVLPATGSTVPMWIPIVGGIVLLLGAGAIVFTIVSRRRLSAAEAPASPVAPADEPENPPTV